MLMWNRGSHQTRWYESMDAGWSRLKHW
jgi:hypothetical protein